MPGRYLRSCASGLQSQALGERLDEELARRVDRETGKDLPSSVRRARDDMTPPSLQHPRQHRAYAVERALAVDLEGTLPLLRTSVPMTSSGPSSSSMRATSERTCSQSVTSVQRPDHGDADATRGPGHHSNPVLEKSHLHAETTLSQRYSRESSLHSQRPEMLTSEGEA